MLYLPIADRYTAPMETDTIDREVGWLLIEEEAARFLDFFEGYLGYLQLTWDDERRAFVRKGYGVVYQPGVTRRSDIATAIHHLIPPAFYHEIFNLTEIADIGVPDEAGEGTDPVEQRII